MLTFYCPNCWNTLAGAEARCPICGYDLSLFSDLTYDQKLILALQHKVPDRQRMAVEILGKLKSEQALPELEKLLADPQVDDYYLLREILIAASRIGGLQGQALIQKAEEHPSLMIQQLARELLAGGS